MGLNDLKQAIELVWSMKFQSKIDSIFSKFPFNPNGIGVVTFEEINHMLNPQGEFYRTISDVMNTCSKKIDGVWHPLDPQNMQLNENIYTQLNQLQALTNLLWDKEGNLQPIGLHIKPVPFVHAPQENPIIVLSYLIVGDQCIRNLNQTPSWQTISIEWWKEGNCSLGVELMNKYTNSRSYKSIQKMNSPWSFFELLKESHVGEENVLTWSVGNENDPDIHISLQFESNPKLLFRVKNR